MNFPSRLRELMTTAGVTAYRLALLTKISQQTIGNYLHGDRAPTLENAQRIARALDLSLSVFDDVVIKPDQERTKP